MDVSTGVRVPKVPPRLRLNDLLNRVGENVGWRSGLHRSDAGGYGLLLHPPGSLELFRRSPEAVAPAVFEPVPRGPCSIEPDSHDVVLLDLPFGPKLIAPKGVVCISTIGSRSPCSRAMRCVLVDFIERLQI